MDDFFYSQIACSKHDTLYWIKTDCWFNHKDLGVLSDCLEKIGTVELDDYYLGSIAPAHTLSDIYDEITQDVEAFCLQLNDTSCLIINFKECGNEK